MPRPGEAPWWHQGLGAAGGGSFLSPGGMGQEREQDHGDHPTSALGCDIGTACRQVPSGRFEFRLVAGGGLAVPPHAFGFTDTLTTGEEEKAMRCVG